MQAQDKVVVVTGGSIGIGEAIAREFLRQGAKVVIAARDAQRLEATRAKMGSLERTLAVPCDVRKHEDLQKLLQATLKQFGRVDVWVNNAGYGLIDSVAEMDLQQVRLLFDTNLFGAIDAMQLVIPVMKQQGEGSILNISSVAGHIAVPGMSPYSATKFALNAISRAARVELLGTGVHVMTVCPGYIDTDFSVNAVKGTKGKRLAAAKSRISADRLARAVFRGWRARKREIVVPWKDRFFIFMYQRAPRLVEHVMRGMLRPAQQVIEQQQANRAAK